MADNEDNDPLRIADGTLKDAFQTLEWELGRVDGIRGDRILKTYRGLIFKLPQKHQEALQAIVTAKIAEQFPADEEAQPELV